MGQTNKMKKILIFQLTLLLIIVVASQEKMGVVISAGADSCNVNPNPRCAAKCLTPGECNKCCKGLGYPRGKCVLLGCNCCN
ncbi:unnamed protein product [Urochloa humidicola]